MQAKYSPHIITKMDSQYPWQRYTRDEPKLGELVWAIKGKKGWYWARYRKFGYLASAEDWSTWIVAGRPNLFKVLYGD